MKQRITQACHLFLLMTIGVYCMSSCINYDDVSRLVNVKVQLQAPDGFNGDMSLQGRDITISNGTSKTTATTDAQGIATFNDVFPDVYDISVSWEITGKEYQAYTGTASSGDGYIITASLNSQVLSEEQETSPVLLKSSASWRPPLVISKIYSAGSKDQNNKNYAAGKYIELYNQTGLELDLGGLYIGLLDSSNPQPYTLSALKEDPAIAGSKVLVKQVFRIPAGQQYTLAPGSAVLITNSATDHSDVSQYEYDLTDADFESKDISGKVVNNPATPALETVFSASGGSSVTMNLVQGGPCGVIIFHTTDDISTWDRTYGYGKTSGSQAYLLVPKTTIYDGVDYLKNKANTGPDVATKRLYEDIDAGFTNINGISGWTGEVVYRRTASKTDDGRKILMDTNNSSNDFQISTTIKPRAYDE